MAVPVQTRTKNRRVLARYAAVGVLAVALILAVAVGNAIRPGPATSALDLDPAPDFTTTLYSGGTGDFTLSAQQGHPVVLNFWGSWCPPCRAEFPALQRAADQYKDQGVVFFGVDVQDARADAQEFLAEQGTTFFTGPDLDNRITIDYQVINFPTTFFITRDGTIYKRWVSLIDDKHLTQNIEELLKL